MRHSFGSYFSPTRLNNVRRIAHVFDVALDSTDELTIPEPCSESMHGLAIACPRAAHITLRHREESQDFVHDTSTLVRLEQKLSVRGTIQND